MATAQLTNVAADRRGDALIELRCVSKSYGHGAGAVRALGGVDLSIRAGEFVSVMGPSGSGKSTLLHLLGALDVPSEGSIRIEGRDISQLDDDALTLFRRRSIGIIFQFFNLLPTLSVLDNALLPVRLERRVSPHDRRRALRLLEDVGLGARVGHGIHQLSGGEVQRVAIARALMLEPRLVLADEPTGNLDSRSGNGVLRLLVKLCREHGTTIVMVTHDERAARVAGRLLSLADGKIAGDQTIVEAADT